MDLIEFAFDLLEDVFELLLSKAASAKPRKPKPKARLPEEREHRLELRKNNGRIIH